MKKNIIEILSKFNALLWWIIPQFVIIAILKNYRLVSFDIFDTLLFRKCKNPINVFKSVEKKYKISDFSQKRQMAEIEARRCMKNNNGEVTYNEIYFQYKKLFNDNNINKYIEYELEEEFNNLYANPYMLRLFNKLKELNIDIIIVSDMYLSRTVLINILRNKGYYGYKDLYVSCEHGINKRNGELQKKASVCYGKFIHIGDNFRADFLATIKIGLNALWYSH